MKFGIVRLLPVHMGSVSRQLGAGMGACSESAVRSHPILMQQRAFSAVSRPVKNTVAVPQTQPPAITQQQPPVIPAVSAHISLPAMLPKQFVPVERFLERHGLGKYEETLRKAGIDSAEVLCTLSKEAKEKLGLTAGAIETFEHFNPFRFPYVHVHTPVANLLERLGLEQYVSVLHAHDIYSVQVMRKLTQERVEEMGIPSVAYEKIRMALGTHPSVIQRRGDLILWGLPSCILIFALYTFAKWRWNYRLEKKRYAETRRILEEQTKANDERRKADHARFMAEHERMMAEHEKKMEQWRREREGKVRETKQA
eukprot:GDKI01049775.1.p1 GENE.GDKI01049775.1~~GDKI01049775.1.p1  ORF type:complete len:312 (-),score=55.58 GDKI01049775.1:46-981(-)